jgi:phenylpropionate dioxygenase-like ring-hydroxylating dioxygenase large terminal subunit
MRSPTRTDVDGFAVLPLTLTCPPTHASVDSVRVEYTRTDHSQRSTRADSTMHHDAPVAGSLSEQIKHDIAVEFERTAPPADFPGFPDIPTARYTSQAFFELEREHLWSKVWVLAGRSTDAAEPGDAFTFDDLGVPLLVARGKDGVLRAFANTCRHRGAPVLRANQCRGPSLRCQYHGWTYDLEGRLVSVPDEVDYAGLCREERALAPASCEEWNGWVFVNRDPSAAPLASAFGRALDELAEYADPRLEAIARRSKVIACNWKVCAEAFLEVMHFRFIHARGPAGQDTPLDHRGAVMGLLPNGCSRMITPFSASACRMRSMQDWSDWQHFAEPGFPDLPAVGPMARSTSTAYSLFPNLIAPVNGYGYPVLTFWPVDVGTTRLDWVQYAPKDWDGDDAPRHWSKRFDQFDAIMGEDTENLEPMQRSLRAPSMQGVPISWQERRIWHLHEQIDRTIGEDCIAPALRVAPMLEPWLERLPA